MAKIHCKGHLERQLKPVMVFCGPSPWGGKQYCCAVCGRMRIFSQGRILKIINQYGFISGEKGNLFFHFNHLAHSFIPAVGMDVAFEIAFFEGDKAQATEVRPFYNGGNNDAD